MKLAVIQLIVLLLGLLGGLLFGTRKVRGALWGTLVAVVANALAVLTMIFARPEFQLYYHGEGRRLFGIYAIAATGILVLLSVFLAFASGRWQIRWHRQRPNVVFFVMVTVWTLAGAIVALMVFASLWTVRTFGPVTPDAVRFFLTGTALADSPPDMVQAVVNQVALPTVLVGALVGLLSGLRFSLHFDPHPPAFDAGVTTDSPRASDSPDSRGRSRHLGVKGSRRLMHLVLAGGLALMVAFSATMVPLVGVARSFVEKSTFIEEYYVEPTAENMVVPKQPKNLVHIFMESIENSYYSREEGGYLDKSLMPELAELTREGVSFSNTDKFGGPRQTPGATHSIAGIINMQSGVPMVPVNFSTEWALAYADFPNLGRILHEQGYQNLFMLGGKRSFHQMGEYFTEYANFEIFDQDTAKERGLVPADYNVWWGIEDDKLYEFAKAELTKLGDSEKPFYFVLENADTHNPDGYLSPNATERPSDSQYGNVIYYSQGEVVKLVRWMQQQPWYQDTVVVITGDHHSKDPKFFAGWDANYERTIVNIILNSDRPRPGADVTNNREFVPFDFFPTIAYAMGFEIEGERLGLGTNLYSGEPTLAEQVGVERVIEEVGQRSDFYEDRMIHDLTRKEFQQ